MSEGSAPFECPRCGGREVDSAGRPHTLALACGACGLQEVALDAEAARALETRWRGLGPETDRFRARPLGGGVAGAPSRSALGSTGPAWTRGTVETADGWIVVEPPDWSVTRPPRADVRWAWSGDGRRLVYHLGHHAPVRAGGVASVAGSVPVVFSLDVPSGRSRAVVLPTSPRDVALSPDGRLLVSVHGGFDDGGELRPAEGFVDCALRVVDLDTGACVRVLDDEDRIPTTARFVDRDTLVGWGSAPIDAFHHRPAGYDVGVPRRWDLRTGRWKADAAAGAPPPPSLGRQSAAGGGAAQAWTEGDGTEGPLCLVVQLGDAIHRRTLFRPDATWPEPSFSPDGERVLVVHRFERRGELLDARDGSLLAEHAEDTLGFGSDGRLLFHRTHERVTEIFGEDGRVLVRAPGTTPVLSAGGAFVALQGDDAVAIHAVSDGRIVGRHPGRGALAVGPDGRRVVTRGASWDEPPTLRGPRRDTSLSLQGTRPGDGGLSFSPCGGYVAGAGHDATALWCFSARTGARRFALQVPGPGGRPKVQGPPAFAARGSRLAARLGFYASQVLVADARRRSVLGCVEVGHGAHRIALSPEGRRLVVTYHGGAVALHHLHRGRRRVA